MDPAAETHFKGVFYHPYVGYNRKNEGRILIFHRRSARYLPIQIIK
jgi:hypothetical protein